MFTSLTIVPSARRASYMKYRRLNNLEVRREARTAMGSSTTDTAEIIAPVAACPCVPRHDPLNTL